MNRLICWKCESINTRTCKHPLDPYVFEASLVGTTTGYSYNKRDTVTFDDVMNELDKLLRHCNGNKIKKVIFNDPATIILWNDGTKSVVKCQNGEEFDAEKGFALAYLKKLLGNDNTFNKEIHKWVHDG